MSAFASSWLEDANPRDLLRWAAAGAIVVSVYAGVIAYFLTEHQPEDAVGGDTDTVIMELAPIDSTPDAEVRDVAPALETMIESKPVSEPQPEKKPDEEKVELPQDEATALIPTPVAKTVEKVEDAPPPAPITAQQVKGGAPRIESSWQTNLVRQLQRYKRYPAEAQAQREEGTVLLSFSVDRNGRVIAHSIARSSGYPDLDNEVTAMILRAEPLPPFPASMTQARLDLTVPIHFSLQ
jgi:protein TonB